MFAQTRYAPSLARKPMVYSRDVNGSARAERTQEDETETDENNNIVNGETTTADSLDVDSDNQKLEPHPPSKKSTPRSNGMDNDTENRPKVYLRPGQKRYTRTKSLLSDIPLFNSKPVLSQPRHYNYDDKLKYLPDDELEKAIAQRNDSVAKGLLSRRRMNRMEMVYFPDVVRNGGGSMRTTRSDPWYDPSRRNLMYGRNLRNMYPNGFGRFRKEVNDKAVAFYRNFNSAYPELRLIINETRFVDLYDLIEDLTKLLHLRDDEKYIHTAYGTIIQDLSQFEDGGIYFFGPPHVYDYTDYDNFRERATPDLIESETGGSGQQSVKSDETSDGDSPPKKKNKEIKVVSNLEGMYRPIRFLVESKRHKSLFQVLYDLTELLLPQSGRVEGLCTRKGKTILSVGELFNSASDEEFVAICAPMYNDAYPGYMYHGEPRYLQDPYYRRGYPYYDTDPLRVLEIEANGKYHHFEPSIYDAKDPFLRKSDLPPSEQLELEWVYGYNGKNCRNNLFIIPSEEIVYFVAKAIVIYDTEAQEQRFYREHTDEIRCLMQHPNLWIFASGQVGGGSEDDHIRVWDSKTLNTMTVISFKEADISIECLAFSQDDNGSKLATISTSGEEWGLSVWNWQEKEIISKSDVYHEVDLACAFDPSDSSYLVSCGKQHIYFWDVSEENASFDEGSLEGCDMPDYVTCLGFNTKNELITGDSNACLHFWEKGNKTTSTILKTKHTGSIITLQVLSKEHVLTGGGSDRLLTLIDCKESVPTVAEAQMAEEYGGIVAIGACKPGFVGTDFANMKLYLGTSMNTLISGTMNTEFECFVSATADQLLDMAMSPKDNTLLITGCDSFTSLKSLDNHSDIWRLKFDFACTAAAFYPTGDVIVIGTSTGNCVVLDVNDSSQLATFQNDGAKITCLSFSPDGALLAVGSESGSISLYNSFDDGATYRYRTSVKTYHEPIISIDWTLDRSHIRFVTSTFNVDYINVEYHREEFRHHVIRELQFEKQTCAFHYSTSGIWKSADKDISFKTVAVTNDKKLLCAGASNGGVRIYNYPAHIKMPMFQENNINSSPISKVLFTNDDKKLLTCGENDYCIAQWNIRSKSDSASNSHESDNNSHGNSTTPNESTDGATSNENEES